MKLQKNSTCLPSMKIKSISQHLSQFDGDVDVKNLLTEWISLPFSHIVGDVTETHIDFWVSLNNPQSGEFVADVRKMICELHPQGSCTYQFTDFFKWDEKDTKIMSPFKVYRMFFFNSTKGLTKDAINDKITHIVKKLEEIVRKYNNRSEPEE